MLVSFNNFSIHWTVANNSHCITSFDKHCTGSDNSARFSQHYCTLSIYNTVTIRLGVISLT